jgi:hypothetical protein
LKSNSAANDFLTFSKFILVGSILAGFFSKCPSTKRAASSLPPLSFPIRVTLLGLYKYATLIFAPGFPPSFPSIGATSVYLYSGPPKLLILSASFSPLLTPSTVPSFTPPLLSCTSISVIISGL